MATYSIKTSRTQEVGLKFSYDSYGDKTIYPTQESYFQYRINTQVTDPMYAEQQRAQAISLDQSFLTIPELQQPSARADMEGVIKSHGGTIVPPGPIQPPTGPPGTLSIPGGIIPPARGTSGNPIQIGGTPKGDVEPSRPDGGGDNKVEDDK